VYIARAMGPPPSAGHPFPFPNRRGICCKATEKGAYLPELRTRLFLAPEKCIQKTWLRKSPIATLFLLFKSVFSQF